MSDIADEILLFMVFGSVLEAIGPSVIVVWLVVAFAPINIFFLFFLDFLVFLVFLDFLDFCLEHAGPESVVLLLEVDLLSFLF